MDGEIFKTPTLLWPLPLPRRCSNPGPRFHHAVRRTVLLVEPLNEIALMLFMGDCKPRRVRACVRVRDSTRPGYKDVCGGDAVRETYTLWPVIGDTTLLPRRPCIRLCSTVTSDREQKLYDKLRTVSASAPSSKSPGF